MALTGRMRRRVTSFKQGHRGGSPHSPRRGVHTGTRSGPPEYPGRLPFANGGCVLLAMHRGPRGVAVSAERPPVDDYMGPAQQLPWPVTRLRTSRLRGHPVPSSVLSRVSARGSSSRTFSPRRSSDLSGSVWAELPACLCALVRRVAQRS
ncbi:hypothetical protein L227DRAFT_7789 [Lentinus tigrinus ALCF2SS1-6]|uniref:Uncharacterized protein n=1 Tax=Lentinus tigrinus ALCF2SS1-6 TaxID=1328759 RepID=A0A5C2SUC0_9APHY|nr:hypothetical protein L227DRAFT_7789 [Lentinus tigrinus ALCF2SS1-6]